MATPVMMQDGWTKPEHDAPYVNHAPNETDLKIYKMDVIGYFGSLHSWQKTAYGVGTSASDAESRFEPTRVGIEENDGIGVIVENVRELRIPGYRIILQSLDDAVDPHEAGG